MLALMLAAAAPQTPPPVRVVAVARARIVSAARVSIGRADRQANRKRPGLVEFQ
jgi:hypothetical protein